MRKKTILVFLSILLVLSSCSKDVTNLSVNINGNRETLCHIILKGKNGYFMQKESYGEAVLFSPLESGVYTIKGVLDDRENPKETEQSLRIDKGENYFLLDFAKAQSVHAITIKAGEDLRLCPIALTLENGEKYEGLISEDGYATFTFDEIEEKGKLFIEVRIKGGTIIGNECAYNFDGKNKINLTLDYKTLLSNGNATLVISSSYSSPVEVVISIENVDRINNRITLRARIVNSSYRSSSYIWYRDGIKIGEGVSLTIDPSGIKRIDLVAYTDKSGSCGSASIYID